MRLNMHSRSECVTIARCCMRRSTSVAIHATISETPRRRLMRVDGSTSGSSATYHRKYCVQAMGTSVLHARKASTSNLRSADFVERHEDQRLQQQAERQIAPELQRNHHKAQQDLQQASKIQRAWSD